jgi:hypothetical protein
MLRKCDPAIFKSYLRWRKDFARIKKESTMGAYWKRISMYYYDVTTYAMGNEVLKDVRNVRYHLIPIFYGSELMAGEVDTVPGT